jgi:hypothetical protein
MNTAKINLMIPLFYLYDIDSLNEVKFTVESSEYLKNTFSLSERLDIYRNLQWAELNPNFHFEDIMKEVPVVGKLKFSNQEVYQYLMLFKTFMEDQSFSLLTEERELKKPEDYI